MRQVGKVWRAQAYYGMLAGGRGRLSASAPTADEAIAALKAAHERAVLSVDRKLNKHSPLSDAVSIWLQESQMRVSPQSLVRYQSNAKRLLGAAGAVPLEKVDAGFVNDLLRAIVETNGLSAARVMRKTLSGVMKMAVGRGAISHNPVRDALYLPALEKSESALTPEQMRLLKTALREWGTNGRTRTDWKRLRDALDIMVGTSARVGEVLALRRCDVDLMRGMVTIAATIVDAGGVHRQDHAKRSRQHRNVPMGEAALSAIGRRMELVPEDPNALLFQTRAGNPVTVASVQKQMSAFANANPALWEELGIPRSQATTHLMRRSAATAVERGAGLELSSSLLGHSSEAITRRHYVTTRVDVPDEVRSYLDAFPKDE